MQSTFSAVEPGGEEMVFADEVEDEDDDDDLDEAATLGKKLVLNLPEYVVMKVNVMLLKVYETTLSTCL